MPWAQHERAGAVAAAPALLPLRLQRLAMSLASLDATVLASALVLLADAVVGSQPFAVHGLGACVGVLAFFTSASREL